MAFVGIGCGGGPGAAECVGGQRRANASALAKCRAPRRVRRDVTLMSSSSPPPPPAAGGTTKTSAPPVRSKMAEDAWNVTESGASSARGGGGRRKVVVIGAGLAGLVTAMELLDAGHEVDIYETRPFAGGKVGSWTDSSGNHIEMGLHVFFGCYYNLFDLMQRVGSFGNLRLKDHRHVFVNEGGKVGELDFRMGPVGAPFNGLKAFFTTSQLAPLDKAGNALALATSPIVRGVLDFDGAMRSVRQLDDISFSEWFLRKGGTRGSIERMWNPIAYALGFLDCDNISARCMLTIFQLFAVRSEASKLRMLEGSPERFLISPLVEYIERRGGRVHLRRRVRQMLYERREHGGGGGGGGEFAVTGLQLAVGGGMEDELVNADAIVAACDVPGIQRLLPGEFRRYEMFDNLYKLRTVPVVTVQLRFDGWVTEMGPDGTAGRGGAATAARGLDNLLYSADADFSCFADLALTSPADYYREGEGSLMQLVLTPADEYLKMNDDAIADKVEEQVRALFPSVSGLKRTWSNVVKLAQSLYREEPGADPWRPSQATPVEGLFLAGSYTYQDYIDSMEGAVKSGKLAARAVLDAVAAADAA